MATRVSLRGVSGDGHGDLVLYTRDGCEPCGDALDAVRTVLGARGTAGLSIPVFHVVDIRSDPALEAAYGNRVPVVRIGDSELDLVVSPRRLAHLLERVLDGVTAA